MSEFGGFEPPSGPPAGWYPDPYGGAGQRYWDGRAWDLSTPVGAGISSADPADDFPDVGDWLDRAFRVAYRRWRALAFLGVLTAPASTAFAYLAIDRGFDGLVIEDNQLIGWSNDRLPAVIAMTLLTIVIGAIGSLSVNVLMLRAVDGDDGSSGTWGDEWSAAWRSIVETIRVLPRAIGWLIVLIAGIAGAALAFVLMALVAAPLAALVLFVTIPFFLWLGIKWSFVVVSVIDRPGNPFPRSSRVSDGRWWRTFGRLLLIGIIIWLVSVIVQTIGAAASGGGFGGFGGGAEITIDDEGNIERFVFDEQFSFDTVEIVVASVVSVATTVLATSVMAAAMSVLYRSRNPRG